METQNNDPRNIFLNQRRDLNNLNKKTTQTAKSDNTKEKSDAKPQTPTAQQINYIKNLAKYYDGKGEDQLIKDIYNNVKAQKQSGKLNDAQIEQFAKTISPMLTSAQREKLEALVIRLKENT